MLKMTLSVLVGVLVWGLASCSIKCPDGNYCTDSQTCCKNEHGYYSCCPYPKAVCCADKSTCCPFGYHCNLVHHVCEKVNQPWMNVPMLEKEEAAEETGNPALSPLGEPQNNNDLGPEQRKSSIIHCGSSYFCPDFFTCCKYPTGGWHCCPHQARCCPDGFGCCRHGLRGELRYPFIPRQTMQSVPAIFVSAPREDKDTVQETPMTALTEASAGNHMAGVIRCDFKFYCPSGSTCCKGKTGQWACCPYPLGSCCADSQHCCEYGYTCDPDSKTCRQGYSQIPSGTQEQARTD